MKAKTTARKKSASKSRRTPQPVRRKPITVQLGRMGADKVRVLNLPTGTTVKDFVKAQGLERYSIRLNGKPVRLSTELKNRDLVVVVPWFIVGASAGRYDHLNLEKYRQTMSARDFKFFVNFVGADRFGFRNGDVEPC